MEFKTYEEEKTYYETVATEGEFLEWYKEQDLKTYETPSVTTDNIIFRYNKETDQLQLLLIKRRANPCRDSYAISGGFANKDESLDDTCIRETYEETGIELSKDNIEQLYTFSTPNRDPRTWVITVGYLVFLPDMSRDGVAGDDASSLHWFDIKKNNLGQIELFNGEDFILISEDGKVIKGKGLAFDHSDIIKMAMDRIENKIDYDYKKIYGLLGNDFTLVEARKLVAKFKGLNYKDIDNSNFRKQLKDNLVDLGKVRKGVIGNPPKVYKLK